jgi:DNA-binding NarL/FixJ family response regulator
MIDLAPTLTPVDSDDAPSVIETLSRSLVGQLVSAGDWQEGGDQAEDDISPDGQVLLDVEIGDVRLLVLRRARPGPISLLSPREQEIARMVACGYPNKTIASVLEISSWTVASHLRRIFIKLQVSSRAAMVTRLSSSALNELSSELDSQAFPPDIPGR